MFFVFPLFSTVAQRCVANLAGTVYAPVGLVGILDYAKPLLIH